MAVSDPIADLLTRIRNSCHAKHRFVDVRFSKIKKNILEVLKQQGFIQNFLVKEEKNGHGLIRIFLKYDSQRKPIINGLKRVSKPSVRRYVGYQEIPKVLGGLGIAVVSTSAGILEGLEARKRKVGGEVLCLVW